MYVWYPYTSGVDCFWLISQYTGFAGVYSYSPYDAEVQDLMVADRPRQIMPNLRMGAQKNYAGILATNIQTSESTRH